MEREQMSCSGVKLNLDSFDLLTSTKMGVLEQLSLKTHRVNFCDNMNLCRAGLRSHLAGEQCLLVDVVLNRFNQYSKHTQNYVLNKNVKKRDNELASKYYKPNPNRRHTSDSKHTATESFTKKLTELNETYIGCLVKGGTYLHLLVLVSDEDKADVLLKDDIDSGFVRVEVLTNQPIHFSFISNEDNAQITQ
jgi:hypothetical protein